MFWRRSRDAKKSPQLSDPSAVSPHEGRAEREWMLKTKGGDTAAFRLVYERFKGPLMSYLYSMVQDRSKAEEILQETFLRAYAHRHSYEPKAKVSTWLWTIARNLGTDHFRKSAHEPSLAQDDSREARLLEELESPLPDAEAQLIEESRREDVEKCLGKLPAPQREALLLRTVSELSYDEISELLKTSLQAVKSLIFRAKASLMECIRLRARA